MSAPLPATADRLGSFVSVMSLGPSAVSEKHTRGFPGTRQSSERRLVRPRKSYARYPKPTLGVAL